MNSSQGLRGFLTFLILLAILGTGVVGFRYVSAPTNTTSLADEPKDEPLNVSVNKITDSSAEITWTTVDSSTSTLIYSINFRAECLSMVEVEDNSVQECQSVNSSESQTSHTVNLSGLSAETTYFFRISTNGKIYPADSNHSFRTAVGTSEPAQDGSGISAPDTSDEYDGFGEVNVGEPQINRLAPDQVLGVSDENVSEPSDPLGDIDGMMQEEFKEALTYGDLRYDFNKDGYVTMADYPLFIEFVMNYEE